MKRILVEIIGDPRDALVGTLLLVGTAMICAGVYLWWQP